MCVRKYGIGRFDKSNGNTNMITMMMIVLVDLVLIDVREQDFYDDDDGSNVAYVSDDN